MNFIVGPNASGKSNLGEALDFLSHVFREDLAFAVAEKGGFYNICHRRQRRARGAISFRIISEFSYRRENWKIDIRFSLRTSGQDIRADFFVDSEDVNIRVQRHDGPNDGFLEISLKRNPQEKYSVTISSSTDSELSRSQKRIKAGFAFFQEATANRFRFRRQSLLLTTFLGGFYGTEIIARDLDGLRVFQLSPRIARQPSAPSVHGELGRRGENLAAAIDRVRLHDKRTFKLLTAWIRDVVPSLNQVITDYTDTRQLGLFFEEEGFSSRWFAEDMSDGTIMSVALFFALLDSRHKVLVIEEPETSLHPWILRRFIERCREQTPNRQIILTTHSPLSVAQARPGELYLIERVNGISTMKKATEIEVNLDDVIRNDLLDLGQYWLSGALGAVPSTPDADQLDLFGSQTTEGED